MPLLFEKYEDNINKVICGPEKYDAIEIQGFARLGEGDEQVVELDNERPDFFSVFAHVKGGGVEDLVDCSNHYIALEYANKTASMFWLGG